MRKAKLSVHATDVKKVLAAYSIDVAASSPDDLAEVSRVCHPERRMHLILESIVSALAGTHREATPTGRRRQLRPRVERTDTQTPIGLFYHTILCTTHTQIRAPMRFFPHKDKSPGHIPICTEEMGATSRPRVYQSWCANERRYS